MRVGESHALARQAVNVRGGNLRLGIVAARITVPHVVGKDHHDVRLRRRIQPPSQLRRKNQRQQKPVHATEQSTGKLKMIQKFENENQEPEDLSSPLHDATSSRLFPLQCASGWHLFDWNLAGCIADH